MHYAIIKTIAGKQKAKEALGLAMATGCLRRFVKRFIRILGKWILAHRSLHEILIPRVVCSQDEWERITGNEYYRMSGIFRDHLPTLEDVLQKDQRRIMFLGGPGMGLSGLATQIQSHLGSKIQNRVFLVSLKGFGGALPIVRSRPEQEHHNVTTWYLLDDLDDVEASILPQLAAEFDRIGSAESNSHIVLFSKQGYAAVQAAQFNASFARYYLLGLASADIQRVCDVNGVDAAAFDDELHRVDVGVEAGNPGVLQKLIQLYRHHGRLPDTRTLVFAEIIGSITGSVRKVGCRSEECLCALGLAMELASRNFLTPGEAELAIGAWFDISAVEAAKLLQQIAPLLLFTAEGILFWHHSFGEYCAASALRRRPLSIVMDLVFFPGTRIPNPSWKSALAFLAEMNSAVRRYLAARHPELALSVSQSALTKQERAAIAGSLHARLRDRREPLAHHPETRIH